MTLYMIKVSKNITFSNYSFVTLEGAGNVSSPTFGFTEKGQPLPFGQAVGKKLCLIQDVPTCFTINSKDFKHNVLLILLKRRKCIKGLLNLEIIRR